MKNIHLALFLFLSTTCIAQEWAPVGAKWYYDYGEGSKYISYTTIESIGDTIVNGKNCKVLQKTSGSYLPHLKDKIITYSDSNIVYYYRDSTFYKLYDFNAMPGDTWTVYNEFNSFCQEYKSEIVTVDSIGTMIINNDTLKYIVVNFPKESWWSYGNHYNKKIKKNRFIRIHITSTILYCG